MLGLLLVACGGGGGNPNGGDDDAQPDAQPDANIPADYKLLVGADWSVTNGSEAYKCIKIQVPSDLWISSFRSLAPQGSHHAVLTVTGSSNTNPMNQLVTCDPSASLLDKEMLYASGVGTDDFVFPEGVAIHLAAGTLINLQLHLFNATDTAITGTSGVLVKTVDQASVQQEASMVFGGRLGFAGIPSDNTPHTVQGTCTAAADFHLIALWPHMHQIATHMSIQQNGAMLLDKDYSFMDQKNYPIADTMVHKNDMLTTTCTYVNNTGTTVNFGEYTTDEMCFSGMYRYPPSTVSNSEVACAYQMPI